MAAADVDLEQVRKAVIALNEFVKKGKKDTKLFLNEDETIMLNVTVWKIPKREQILKITLPHEIRVETKEVCLFTKDEPNMNTDQTQKYYKNLLNKHGVKNITQIIPYKALKTEYKPFEAKRRLLSRFDLFLADDRIRRLLPSHLGKHFYKAKKAPLSVKLSSKNLAKELNKLIQGTILPISNKGSCYASQVAHSGMKLEEVVENVTAVISTIEVQLPQQWKNVKILHLKTTNSPALPIYTSNMYYLKELQKKDPKKRKQIKKQKKAAKMKNLEAPTDEQSSEVTNVLFETVEKNSQNIKPSIGKKHCAEEIPQLVPIDEQTPAKKAKLQKLQGVAHTTPKPVDENVTPVGKKPQQIKHKKMQKTPNKNLGSLKPQTPGKKGKGLEISKPEVKENEFSLEKIARKKTAKKPERKSLGAPKTMKTPKQKKKQKIPQSV
ncbi:ribosomal L1 domain-containing protein 1 [Leucoraja erinacea]|uniref:ribosomal L1 domain-containing protein 1 n=1 Tax=Leucoraja erinaceus TaxID=7782 RepID=UPI0024583991|nr:ribosomal L1 domain-containing protein 1 [Leucoraja erinacea]